MRHQSNNLALHNDWLRQDCYSGIASLGMRGHRLFTRVIIIFLEEMATQFPTQTEPVITEDQNCISIEEARNCIKTKFLSYHQLLDERESELISELNQLEETNKPELTQVRHDINQLTEASKYLDESLGANTLKYCLEEQRSLLCKQILNLQRSESLLGLVTLNYSDIECSIKNAVNINPFLSNAKFRTQLKPFLDLKPRLAGEDWYIISKTWLSSFTDSINLTNPKSNDSLVFPARIPIETSTKDAVSIVDSNNKLLHSKAWNMLLAFNGLSSGSIPIKRQSYLDETTNRIEIPIQATKHKCTIGHNDGDNKFSLKCEIEAFPFETTENILKQFGFSTLLTDYPPIIYTLDNTSTISCNTPHYTQYTVQRNIQGLRSNTGSIFSSSPRIIQNRLIPDAKPISVENKMFLVIIPDSRGNNPFQVM